MSVFRRAPSCLFPVSLLTAVPLLLFSLPTLAAAPPQTGIELAASLARRARDTQNPADFRQADLAAAKVLAADANNFEAQRYRAVALLGQQDLAGALELALKLNKRVPDDIGVWAILSEIQAARGDYAEAERCAQWVLDLRRNSPAGFSAAARLRAVYGDYEGAADFYSEAFGRTPQFDPEERSWLLVQNARMLILMKNFTGAVSLLDRAEKLFPGSLQVLEQRAALARMQGDFAQAASLLAQESRESPTVEHLYAYARALAQAGKQDEASLLLAKVNANAAAAGTAAIFYYADGKKDPEAALRVATQQAALRQDTATLDAYAWALYRAGRFAEARTQIDKVLAVGTREPEYVCHAVRIASRTRDVESAAAHLPEGACENIP